MSDISTEGGGTVEEGGTVIKQRFRRRNDAKLASVFLSGVLAGGVGVTSAMLLIVWFLHSGQ